LIFFAFASDLQEWIDALSKRWSAFDNFAACAKAQDNAREERCHDDAYERQSDDTRPDKKHGHLLLLLRGAADIRADDPDTR
jgi:hypothetical protein